MKETPEARKKRRLAWLLLVMKQQFNGQVSKVLA